LLGPNWQKDEFFKNLMTLLPEKCKNYAVDRMLPHRQTKC